MKKGEKNETEEMELGGNFSGIGAGFYDGESGGTDLGGFICGAGE